MRVRCKKTRHSGVRHDLTRGAEYEVLAIEAGDLRIIDDRGRPYLFPRELFRVVDRRRPGEWITETHDGLEYSSAPELSHAGFFEDFFVGKREAVRTFHQYVNRHLRLTRAA